MTKKHFWVYLLSFLMLFSVGLFLFIPAVSVKANFSASVTVNRTPCRYHPENRCVECNVYVSYSGVVRKYDVLQCMVKVTLYEGDDLSGAVLYEYEGYVYGEKEILVHEIGRSPGSEKAEIISVKVNNVPDLVVSCILICYAFVPLGFAIKYKVEERRAIEAKWREKYRMPKPEKHPSRKKPS
ncbi:MAG TPA: hypothetical protein H9683_06610 [Firmicutes bacterium]|nr:hypothetical protein [Bacillota bacterium]